MRLAELQASMLEALLKRQPLPKQLGVQSRICDVDKAFSVYRNNIYVSLMSVLRGLYPITAAAYGDGFKAIASAYIQAKPPKQPHLIHYGEDFADFLSSGDSMPYPHLDKLARGGISSQPSLCRASRFAIGY